MFFISLLTSYNLRGCFLGRKVWTSWTLVAQILQITKREKKEKRKRKEKSLSLGLALVPVDILHDKSVFVCQCLMPGDLLYLLDQISSS